MISVFMLYWTNLENVIFFDRLQPSMNGIYNVIRFRGNSRRTELDQSASWSHWSGHHHRTCVVGMARPMNPNANGDRASIINIDKLVVSKELPVSIPKWTRENPRAGPNAYPMRYGRLGPKQGGGGRPHGL